MVAWGVERGALRQIVEIVHRRTGTDFSTYRPATVERRIQNRMISLGLDDAGQYVARLLAEPLETWRLVERLTIKVSRFYRNGAAFDCLRREVLPMLARRAEGRPLRVWSAGCACGEEAWSLAMLLQEVRSPGVVEASDLDAKALEVAREGIYSDDVLDELPDDLRERYLAPLLRRGHGAWRVRSELRSRVRFVQQDITLFEPPTGRERYDLVCCRNVLIYLQRPTQRDVFARLLAAVAPGGCLSLGEAEWPPPSYAERLRCLGRKTRVFQRVDEESGEVGR